MQDAPPTPTVNSHYNQVGYNEIPAYNEMDTFPQCTKCINYDPLIRNLQVPSTSL